MKTQAATARQPKVAKVAKSQYKPHIRRESTTTFTVQSETYVHILHTITVDGDHAVCCDCPGNHDWGKVCKHMRAITAYLAYALHPSHIRPMVDEAAPVLVAPIELAARRKVAPAFIPAPADFAEIFG